MTHPEDGHLLRIFIGESDRGGGQPRYEWIVRKARRVGLATVEKVRNSFYLGAEEDE